MSKHTPGPWKVIGGKYGLPEVWNADQTEAVCERVFNGNSALIAAAPDLLDLLLLALPYVEEGEQFNHPRKRDLSRRIREILDMK